MFELFRKKLDLKMGELHKPKNKYNVAVESKYRAFLAADEKERAPEHERRLAELTDVFANATEVNGIYLNATRSSFDSDIIYDRIGVDFRTNQPKYAVRK